MGKFELSNRGKFPSEVDPGGQVVPFLPSLHVWQLPMVPRAKENVPAGQIVQEVSDEFLK